MNKRRRFKAKRKRLIKKRMQRMISLLNDAGYHEVKTDWDTDFAAYNGSKLP